ncbi:MAG: type II secretion system F family protein, partial [Cellulosimicrobium funkei]
MAVGLLLGAGLFCVWWSFWAPGPPRVRRADGWAARTQDLLVQAGAPAVTPGALVVASVGVGLVVLVVGTVLARSWTIAACFAVIAAGAPSLLVRSRARRRRARLREVWPEVL